jgi:hypothetical protein
MNQIPMIESLIKDLKKLKTDQARLSFIKTHSKYFELSVDNDCISIDINSKQKIEEGESEIIDDFYLSFDSFGTLFMLLLLKELKIDADRV